MPASARDRQLRGRDPFLLRDAWSRTGAIALEVLTLKTWEVAAEILSGWWLTARAAQEPGKGRHRR